jgi:threonine/homoserine/homoserine lactone efflux protein
MNGAPLLGLVVTGLAVMGSPGPSTVSLVAVTAAYGVRPAIAYCVGLIVGTTVVLLAVATGMTALLLALPLLRWALLALAVAYILRLALRLARSSGLGGSGALDRRPSLVGGLVLGALNPKAWVAIGAVFVGARLAAGPVLDAASKVLVLTVLIVVIHVGWLAAGRLAEPLLRSPRRARAVNVTLAGMLLLAMIPLLVP